MRYYLINSDNEEIVFDIVATGDVYSINGENYYIRKLADKIYMSQDNKHWEKIVSTKNVQTIVDKSQVYKLYRGFKPSGLFNANAGDLITDMPGKIAKVLVKEGTKIKKGDTLLILEAMKMENEIKAGVDGIVKSINVETGQTVESGFLMLEIEE